MVDNARWVQTPGRHLQRNTSPAGTEVDRLAAAVLEEPAVPAVPAAAGAGVSVGNSKIGQAQAL